MNCISRIAFTHDGWHLIEASAGTGKTWVVEHLLIKALLECPHLNIDNILILSFTNNAVNELKQRISQRIHQILDYISCRNNQDNSIKEFLLHFNLDYALIAKILFNALQNFDNNSIYTIHGFCKKIIDNRLNTGVNFEIVADYSELICKLLFQFIQSHITNNLYITHNITQIYDQLYNMFGSTKIYTIIDKLISKLPSSIKKNIQPIIESAIHPKDLANFCTWSEEQFLDVVIKYLIQNLATINKNILSYDDLIQIVMNKINNLNIVADYPIAIIDEFQDTDEKQWYILEHIYQTGKLILVGDPKQAIYSFRGANLDVYLTVRSLVNDINILDQNYRSHANIVNFLNQIFTHSASKKLHMMYSDAVYQELYAAQSKQLLLPAATNIQKHILRLANNLYPFYDEQVHLISVENDEQLLQSIAFEILSLLNYDITLYNKIAILAPYNHHVQCIAKQLEQYNILVQYIDPSSVFTTKIVSDFYLVLRAIANFNNHNLLCRALTTNIFNYSIQEIHNMQHDATSSLSLLKSEFNNYNDIWQRSGIEAMVITLIRHRQFHNMHHVLHVLELINQYVKSSAITDVLSYLEYKIKLNHLWSTPADETIRQPNNSHAVTIMTQHKSKGLEYDILFCPYFMKQADSQQLTYEVHRLNYVTLTRAKSRVYIYISKPKITKHGNYHKNGIIPIHSLFGQVIDEPNNTHHPLFHYPNFFTSDMAIKQPDLLPGVVAYSRSLEQSELINLQLDKQVFSNYHIYTAPLSNRVYRIQSYSSLVKNMGYYHHIEEYSPNASNFGNMFHELCEHYPCEQSKLTSILLKYPHHDKQSTLSLLKRVFEYNIFNNFALLNLSPDNSIRELEFTLAVNNCDLKDIIIHLLSKHYGAQHPFTISSQLLHSKIYQGYLHGFIDLIFKYNEQYWILDYKTNSLSDYQSSTHLDYNAQLTISISKHHYYLQYLLYMLAIKQYLQQTFNLSDAKHLLGGVCYFYIRGVETNGGIYLDSTTSVEFVKDLECYIGLNAHTEVVD